jgi:hypothetical protein
MVQQHLAQLDSIALACTGAQDNTQQFRGAQTGRTVRQHALTGPLAA